VLLHDPFSSRYLEKSQGALQSLTPLILPAIMGVLHVLLHVPLSRYCEELQGTSHKNTLLLLLETRGGLHVASHVRFCGSQNNVEGVQGMLQSLTP